MPTLGAVLGAVAPQCFRFGEFERCGVVQLESREHAKHEAVQKLRQQTLDRLQESGAVMKAASSGARTLSTSAYRTVSTPNIGPLQTLNRDLRPRQIALPDPKDMFKRLNVSCCYGSSR